MIYSIRITDTKSSLVRMKSLKKNPLLFLGAIVEYNDELPFVSLTEFPLPNVNLAAEGQPEEIGKIIY